MARSCPQIGILSPLIWCLIGDELITRLNGVGFTLKDMQTFFFKRWENFQIHYQGSYNGPFILLKRGVTSSACRLTPTRLEFLYSREEENSQDSWITLFWDELATLHDGRVPRSGPGHTADLKGARGC